MLPSCSVSSTIKRVPIIRRLMPLLPQRPRWQTSQTMENGDRPPEKISTYYLQEVFFSRIQST
eukprot:scaffold10238_cov276-Chaetoceros_neogracile.AAC.18